jgi:type VI secretion system protein ImpF
MSGKGFKTQASLLDRLIDYEPSVSREPVQNRLTDFRQLMTSVRRDIENLLNTKNFTSATNMEYRELQNSLYSYGLPDFTAQNPRGLSVRDYLCDEVEKAIARFEPRLANVVVVNEATKEEERNLGFKIMGMLMVDPSPEPVTFDTHFDVNRGEYVVK